MPIAGRRLFAAMPLFFCCRAVSPCYAAAAAFAAATALLLMLLPRLIATPLR